MNRAIVVFDRNNVEIIKDYPMPSIGSYECLVQIKSCGFCNGTDYDIITNTMSAINFNYPIVLGHENAGEVVEIGKNVKHIKIGNKFINCPGRLTAGYSSGFGQMIEYAVITDLKSMQEDGLDTNKLDRSCFISRQIPDDFDIIDAGVILTLTECYSAVLNFGVQNKDVLIYGSGPMGLAIMKFMRIVGAKSISVIDLNDERLALAKKIANVDLTINTKTQNIENILEDKMFDMVIDAVGSTSVIIEGSRRLKPYGIVGALGVLKSGDSTINLSNLKNNTLIHMLNFPFDQHDKTSAIVDMIERIELDPHDFYSHTYPIEQIHEAINMVRNKKALKIILTF